MKTTLRTFAILAFVLATFTIQAAADGLPVPTCDPYVTKNCHMPLSGGLLVR